jgi:hypothetical protein
MHILTYILYVSFYKQTKLVTWHEPLLCYKVIYFIAALSLKIAFKVQHLYSFFIK